MSLHAVHPVAAIFPLIEGAEFQALVADIKAHGVREPIWLHPDGRVIDGRNRMRAAEAAGVQVPTRKWDGTGSLVEFVLSMNLHRRQLTSSQRAVVALEVEPLLAEEAKERQRRGGQVSHQGTQIVEYADRNDGAAAQQAAKATGTNRQYVVDAKRIAQQRPDLLEQVREGAISIPEAVRQAKGVHVANNSGENEWYTPSVIIKAAADTMGGIDVDPASSDIAQQTVDAAVYYTKETNGLEQDWHGRIWMNPPYAQPLIGKFVDKLKDEFALGHAVAAIVLVNNGTETGWGQTLLEMSNGVCFPKARIKFLDPDGKPGAPLQGQMIVYVGRQPDKFRKHFTQFGVVL